MSNEFDVVVIGAGAMGSAAAWQAARRGKRVLVLERFLPGHDFGASHGTTRNFNTAYAQPEYLALVQESRILWDALAVETGVQLLDLVGLVNHGDDAPMRRVRRAHAEVGIRSEFLSAAEAERRWAGMHFRSEVLYTPEAGRIRAADALVALRTAAESHGAVFRYESPARGVEVVAGDRARVVTDDAVYDVPAVIVTAGAWTTAVLGGVVQLPGLVVTQEQPVHFAVADETAVWPSFNHFPDPAVADDDYWYSETYGLFTPGEGVKVGWHGVGPVTDPDRRSFSSEPVQLAALQRYARQWLPGVHADRFVEISCTYTSTDTKDFVLDRIGLIVIGAGFAGMGFKFTPGIGRILADLVDGIPSPALFRGDLRYCATHD